MMEERHGAVRRKQTVQKGPRREGRREGEKERGMCGWRSPEA